MRKYELILCASLLLLSAETTLADPSSDATTLKNEALEILKANANGNATAKQYANCIFKLEKAQLLLEKAGDTDSALAQEVSSTLFWSRRFSNLEIIKELDLLHGGAPPPPTVKKDPPTPPPAPAKPADPEAPPEPPAGATAAKAAYQAAEAFAQSHSGDDYAIALRWFQMANENPGNDYALKAVTLAQAAQARFAAKQGVKEEVPDVAEAKPIKEGDSLAERGKYEESIVVYSTAIKLKETALGHRRLASAYYRRAQQMKDELLPRMEAVADEVRAAYNDAFETKRRMGGGEYKKYNRNYPPLLEAQKKYQALVKEAYGAIEIYDKAQSEYKAVLRMAPNGKDLDAAGHIGLCLGVRGDMNARLNARKYLLQFLNDYKPANDFERSIYEFCKTEFERIKK